VPLVSEAITSAPAPLKSLTRYLLAFLSMFFLASATAQSESERWSAVFSAIPPPPASLAEALLRVRGRGDPWGFHLEVSDPRMRDVEKRIEALQARLWGPPRQEVPRLPIGLPPSTNTAPAYLDSIQQAAQAAAEAAQRSAAAPFEVAPKGAKPPPAQPTSPQVAAMTAYSREILFARQEPSHMEFFPAFNRMRERYGARHWQAYQAGKQRLRDQPREFAQVASELVRKHHAIAAEHLSEASVVLVRARAAMAPQVERMTRLARDAEANGASASDLKEAHRFINERVASLHDMHKDLLLEMGHWAGMQPAKAATGQGDFGVHAHAPTTELMPALSGFYRGVWRYEAIAR
jgi:hypothetical protein